ncbi:AdoMet_MTases domain containing protein [actinobacterium SCGC AAA044-D11]
MTKSLDLGCGPNPKNPFLADEVFGIDINTFNNPNIKIADLAIDPIPFEGNTFDYISGFDFLEHIPRILYIGRERKQPFIDVMSEIWRVLKPGGETFFATPAYPTPEAFQDPQHVNIITENSIGYFSAPGLLELCQAYGFKGKFEVVQQAWANVPIKIRENSFYHVVPYHLVWHLKAVK